MTDTKIETPPSLSVVPNIPVREQTDEQLELERAYWEAKLDGYPSWGAAVGAASEFLRACTNEQERRKKAK